MNQHVTKSLATFTLALAIVLSSSAAQADPPHGDEFDAPETFDAAVLISPNARGNPYNGVYELVTFAAGTDIDYYKFTVSQGQNISVSCTQYPYPYDWAGTEDVRYPCTIRLLDPAGIDQSAGISSDGLSTQILFENAGAGDWRLEVSGTDFGPTINECCQVPTYRFSVTLAPDVAGAAEVADETAAGSFGQAVSLLLLAGALVGKLRRSRQGGERPVRGRHSLAALALALGATAGLSACRAPDSRAPADTGSEFAGSIAQSACVGSLAGGGTEVWTDPCVNCDIANAARAIDGRGDTYASIDFNHETLDYTHQGGNAAMHAIAQSGVVFPAGNKAGVLLQMFRGDAGSTLTIQTWLGDAVQETATEEVFAGDAPLHVFETTLPFDTVEIRLIDSSIYNAPEFRVYEFCGNA
jgi:hypothetical protein